MSEVEPSFRPFVLSGTVSIPGSEHRCIKILWDNRSSAICYITVGPVFFRCNAMLFRRMLLEGMEMGLFNLPLHYALLQIDLASGIVRIGVCNWLPVRGVEIILGNDLEGGNAFNTSS